MPYMEESMLLETDSSIFTDVTYLGAAAVSAPKSDAEIYRNMTIFNELMQKAVPITLSVPSNAEGNVQYVALYSNSFLKCNISNSCVIYFANFLCKCETNEFLPVFWIYLPTTCWPPFAYTGFCSVHEVPLILPKSVVLPSLTATVMQQRHFSFNVTCSDVKWMTWWVAGYKMC